MTKTKVLKIENFKGIDLPKAVSGDVRIHHTKYNAGYYFHEGVDGYLFCELKNPAKITCLSKGRKMMMVDDPLHYYGMKRLAENSFGDVLVGGLGLGMVTNFLIDNPAVNSITVYEVNADVINLIKPHIKESKKVKIIHGDFFKDQPFDDKYYDTVLIDFWVQSPKTKNHIAGMNFNISPTAVYCKIHFSVLGKFNKETKILIWGVRDKKLNPAVTIDIPETIIENLT